MPHVSKIVLCSFKLPHLLKIVLCSFKRYQIHLKKKFLEVQALGPLFFFTVKDDDTRVDHTPRHWYHANKVPRHWVHVTGTQGTLVEASRVYSKLKKYI